MKMFAILLSLVGAASIQAAERAIELEVIVKAPVEAVWKAWTTTAGIKTFFAPDANVDLRVDGPFEIFIDPLAKPGDKGADGMRIIGFQEGKMLSFTWNAPPSLPEVRKQRSLVILRFEAMGPSETKVTLFHAGWGVGGEWDKAFAYFSKAWPSVLANLQDSFVKGPKDWTAWLEQLKKLH
jgi:uncharacterized protein YndB with AHSA1/START domain